MVLNHHVYFFPKKYKEKNAVATPNNNHNPTLK